MKTKLLISMLCLLGLFLACKKQTNTSVPSPVAIRLTDAPGPYDAVFIDLQGVELTGQGKTVMLNVTPGIYNLLDFTNGKDTLIATGSFDAAKVQQVRLILGSANSVWVDSVAYPLTIPSGSESGLKIQVHKDLEAGVAYQLLLDFDALQSVVENGKGEYHLKPVIRAVENALSGSIRGQLSQAGVNAAITAAGNTGTFSTVPDPTGRFIIQGTPAGTYTLSIVPAAPHSSLMISPVTVTTGVTTQVGTVTI
jgi:hypothetical protein